MLYFLQYSVFKYVFVIKSKFLAHQIIVKYVAFQELNLLLVKNQNHYIQWTKSNHLNSCLKFHCKVLYLIGLIAVF